MVKAELVQHWPRRPSGSPHAGLETHGGTAQVRWFPAPCWALSRSFSSLISSSWVPAGPWRCHLIGSLLSYSLRPKSSAAWAGAGTAASRCVCRDPLQQGGSEGPTELSSRKQLLLWPRLEPWPHASCPHEGPLNRNSMITGCSYEGPRPAGHREPSQCL